MRLFIVANAGKPQVQAVLGEWTRWLEERVQLVGIETDCAQDLAKIAANAILVLGGDGTLLSVARRLAGRQIPLMGVNFGRLGFLASFTPAAFKGHFESLLQDKLPIGRRLMIEASVVPAGVTCRTLLCEEVAEVRRFVATALNEAVVTAGPPFNMIELNISADGEPGVNYYGDGVICSTPSGSTAYNLSAGGPIISPNVDSLCITPICPHSLSFRPVVISSATTVVITPMRVNEGTTLFCDGQASTQLHRGERIVIRRSRNDVLLIENPDSREWRTLAEKLHWAIGPGYGV